MLIVTGPPRSGTSLVCNLLQGLGCEFGDQELLIPGNRWNELGYFENTEIIAMNHRLILGSLVNDKPWTESVWPEGNIERVRRLFGLVVGRFMLSPTRVMRRASQYRAELESLMSKYAACTVKDPRFCFTLPAWRPRVRRVLFCLRHPREVAESMSAQSGFPPIVGYYAWHRWVSWFWRQPHPYPVAVVDYNRLVHPDHNEAEMRRLFGFAGRPFDPAEARRVGGKTVRDDLRHQRADAGALPFPIRKEYERLRDRHSNAEDVLQPTGT